MALLAQYVEPIIYGYPTGRVRVLEGKLLPLQRLERLIEARDFAEQRRILGETAYGELFSEARTAEDVEAALDTALGKAYEFMEESFLPEPIIEFFRVRYDLLNLRMLLKTRLAGAPTPERWSRHGSVPAETFEAAAGAEGAPAFDELPPGMARLAGEIAEAVGAESGEADRRAEESPHDEEARGRMAAAIDTAVDKALYERIRQATVAQKSPWFERLGRIVIDLANARICLRAVRFGKDADWLATALIEGGNTPVGEIVKIARTSPDEVAARILGAAGLPRDLEETLSEQLTLGMVDVAADNVVIRYSRGSRMIAVGLEPIVGYLLAAENEIMLLRIVLLGKLANLPSAKIHERVRGLGA